MTITPRISQQMFLVSPAADSASAAATRQLIRISQTRPQFGCESESELGPSTSTVRGACAIAVVQSAIVRGKSWTAAEHERFLEGFERFPAGPWKAIAAFVGTKNARQTMTHAQKYRQKIARRGIHQSLPPPSARSRLLSNAEWEQQQPQSPMSAPAAASSDDHGSSDGKDDPALSSPPPPLPASTDSVSLAAALDDLLVTDDELDSSLAPTYPLNRDGYYQQQQHHHQQQQHQQFSKVDGDDASGSSLLEESMQQDAHNSLADRQQLLSASDATLLEYSFDAGDEIYFPSWTLDASRAFASQFGDDAMSTDNDRYQEQLVSHLHPSRHYYDNLLHPNAALDELTAAAGSSDAFQIWFGE